MAVIYAQKSGLTHPFTTAHNALIDLPFSWGTTEQGS